MAPILSLPQCVNHVNHGSSEDLLSRGEPVIASTMTVNNIISEMKYTSNNCFTSYSQFVIKHILYKIKSEIDL